MSIAEDFNTIKHNNDDLSTSLKKEVKEESLPARPIGRTDSLTDAELWQEFVAREDEQEVLQPRLVTRGPHMIPPSPLPINKSNIDTLTFTLEESVDIVKELISLCSLDEMKFIPQRKGINGYLASIKAIIRGQEIATICYGAKNEKQNDRPLVHIDGHGCPFIDFNLLHHYISLTKKPRITRIDIAFDMYRGEVRIEDVRKAHEDGKFKVGRANKNPLLTPYGEIQPDGRNPGRTLYIGSMSSGKFLRAYEKAYQVLSYSKLQEDDPSDLMMLKFINHDEAMTIGDFNNGEEIKPSEWLRMELQLRNTNCELPMEILVKNDQYFSGSYPFCSEVLGMADGIRPERMATTCEFELKKRVGNIKPICSPTMSDLWHLGYSKEEIFDILCDIGTPSQKLIKSGLLGKVKPEVF